MLELRDDDVRRGEEHGDGRDHSEQREDDEAQAVHYHGGELPVVRHFRRLVLLAQLVRDDPQLLEDERELSVRSETRRAAPAAAASPVLGVRTPQKARRRRLQRACAAAVVPEVVVDVEHVGQQALGGALLQLQLAQLQRLPSAVRLAAWSAHAQEAGQPVQENGFDLREITKHH